MSRRLILPIAVVLVAAVLALTYFLFDPTESTWMPQCPVHLLTGFDCPGCGSQRMLHALLHGDISGAWHHNALLLLMLPLLAVMLFLELAADRFPRAYRRIHSLPVVALICLSIAAWTIIRNC